MGTRRSQEAPSRSALGVGAQTERKHPSPLTSLAHSPLFPLPCYPGPKDHTQLRTEYLQPPHLMYLPPLRAWSVQAGQETGRFPVSTVSKLELLELLEGNLFDSDPPSWAEQVVSILEGGWYYLRVVVHQTKTSLVLVIHLDPLSLFYFILSNPTLLFFVPFLPLGGFSSFKS